MMKLLPLILLCTLLCGCGQTASPDDLTRFPTESVVGTASEPEEFGGSVRTAPLNLQAVQGFRMFEGNVLLFSGDGSTTLILLDPERLKVSGTYPLTFHLDPEDPSLMLHPSGRLSFYDPHQEATLLLDRQLREVSSISSPGGLSGSPILSRDETTLFYCTASHVRALDLASGIRRCVKEMRFPSQTLSGVHMEDSVLACRITDNGRVQTLFLSAEDGQLLHQGTDILSLETWDSGFFALVRAGSYPIPVYGTDPHVPIMYFSETDTAHTYFLPEYMAAITAFPQENRTYLEHRSLTTGRLSHRIMLEPFQELLSAEAIRENMLLLLTVDSRTGQNQLVFWEPEEDASESSACPAVPYRPSDAPDIAGLSRCRKQADALETRYGIRILLWEDAAVSSQWEAEHLVPILQLELKLLEERLSQYPQAVLQETAAHFSSLNLCLLRSSGTDTPTGAYFLDGSDAYIAIPTGSSGENALYHQLFHLMETHIFGRSKAFDQWNTLNPAGFHYDYDYAANARRDSGVYLFEDSRSFVDTFSMSYPKEDRARIMEYAMLPGQDALFRSPAMQRKLTQLCTGIRDAYDLDGKEGAYLWEQYLE